jgi:hypothetical protein
MPDVEVFNIKTGEVVENVHHAQSIIILLLTSLGNGASQTKPIRPPVLERSFQLRPKMALLYLRIMLL